MAAKLGPATTVIVSFLLLSLASILLATLAPLREYFGATQPGTLVQLATSHVPTAEDEELAKREWEQIRKDLRDMTETGGLVP